MVIPLGGMGAQLRGPVPDECAGAVQRLKITVLVMVACVIGRVLTAVYMGIRSDFFNLLYLVLIVIMGTFVLKDDEHFKRGYEFLATTLCTTCHDQGMGGLGCLMPFVMCSGIQFVFDLILKLGPAMDPKFMPYGLFLLGTIAAEGAGAYFGWNMMKTVRDNGLGLGPDVEMGSGGLGAMQGGFLGGGARQYQPAQQGMDQSGPPSQGQQQQPAPPAGFQPFGGAGQRLGG